MAKGNETIKMPIADAVREYNNLGTQAKIIKTRRDSLAEFIKNYSKTYGIKDSKGNYNAEADRFQYGSTAKKTVKLNFEKARRFFVGRKLWDKVKVIKEDIDEEAVSKLVEDGTLTVDEVEKISDIDVSFSVYVKEKETPEEMPEIETSKAIKCGRFTLTLNKK
jgi:adenine-specific DNA methylase